MFNIDLLFDFLYWMENPVWKLKKRWTLFTKTLRYPWQPSDTDVSDEERSGRPIEVTTEEMIEKIQGIVLNDQRIKVCEIVEIVGISHPTSKIGNAKTYLQDGCRLYYFTLICKEVLWQFQLNPTIFLRRFITVDETWVHHYTPETKEG